MSLRWNADSGGQGCFPRVSGDEPAWELYRREWEMFSPRERG